MVVVVVVVVVVDYLLSFLSFTALSLFNVGLLLILVTCVCVKF